MIEPNKKQSRDNLLHLLVFTAAVFVLAFVFVADPAYAPSPDTVIEPGGGPVPYTVEGTIVDWSTGMGVSGMAVYLYVTPADVLYTTTNAGGIFHFHDYCIQWRHDYTLTVNGLESSLGNSVYSIHYGQMRVTAHTDDIGYANLFLRLQPSTIQNVPAAALFSNTKYATLRYGRDTISTFSHISTFSVAGTGIERGYMSSTSASYEFGGQPLVCWYVGKPFYAASVWDDSKPGIVSSGILHEVENYDWGTYLTQEYKNSNGLVRDYLDFDIASGTYKRMEYKETGSQVWSDTLGVDFSIRYTHFGIPIKLDTTVSGTEGITNWVSYIVDRRGDENHSLLTFRVYSPGGFRDIDNPDPEKHYGGLELHIWDISGAG